MSSISTPTSLATFSNPHASGSKQARPHVALSPVFGQSNLAVAAVQGDGVWTYDLNTLRPTTSFTVPPGTVFSTPALSWVPLSNKRKGKQKATEDAMDVDVEDLGRKTIVGVYKGDGLAKGEEGRTLWAWSGEDSSKKETISLPCAAQDLHLAQDTSSNLVVIVGNDGELSLLDHSSTVRPIALSSPKRALKNVRASRLLSSTLVLVDSTGHVVKISLSLDDPENTTGRVLREGHLLEGQRKLPVGATDIDDNGLITAVVGDELISYDIDNSPTLPTYPQFKHTPSTPLVLSLPSLGGKPLAILSYDQPSPSLLLVTPSPLLPAVLLAHDLSPISHGGIVAALSIISKPSANTFVIGVVIAHHTGNEGRSVVHTCEVTIPLSGIGMSALLGSRQRSSEYIRFTDSGAAEALSKEDRLFLSQLSDALKQGDEKEADRLWANRTGTMSTEAVPEAFAKEVLQEVLRAALRTTANSNGETAAISSTYCRSIVEDLLSRKAVNDGMWEGGLVLAGLLPLDDWDNIRLAVKSIASLSPGSLISLLKRTISPSQPGSTPTTDTLFADILSLPAPSPAYRPELRRGMSVQEATILLDCLVKWAERHVANIGKDFTWDPESALGTSATGLALDGVPSLDSIITHSSVLLDAHLPNFLAYEPSFDSLARLQSAIEPLLALQEDFDRLRAPIDAVITLARREERRLEEEAKKAARNSRADKASRQTGTDKGGIRKGGRLPEEMVGKWRVEDFVF